MSKPQYYLSQCIEAAAKSPMCFTLGAVMVKGGKILSTGYNHYRTHYDGNNLGANGRRKVSIFFVFESPLVCSVQHESVLLAGFDARRDARHLQFHRHVSFVQDAGSSHGKIKHETRTDRAVQITNATTRGRRVATILAILPSLTVASSGWRRWTTQDQAVVVTTIAVHPRCVDGTSVGATHG